MSENSKIEWTDHTFNPWIGCTKVSPACDHCYAEALARRYGWVEWGGERKRTSDANWRKPKKWDLEARASSRQTFVFCASLADVFDNEIDARWRADLFSLIRSTSNLTWLLLTKRIGNVRKMVDVMPRNVAIGSTMANQEEYDRDRMKLADVKREFQPAFTFASIEPMLGPVILDKNAPDWIICGGESGHGARMMDPQWARDLRDGAARFQRKFFMKQMTSKKPIPTDLFVREFPAGLIASQQDREGSQ
jgi:protein gp37